MNKFTRLGYKNLIEKNGEDFVKDNSSDLWHFYPITAFLFEELVVGIYRDTTNFRFGKPVSCLDDRDDAPSIEDIALMMIHDLEFGILELTANES